MNENINLVKILKDCPIGTKLYSPLFGEVIFDGIEEAWDCDNQEIKNIVVITETTDSESFSEYGVYFNFSCYDNSECMLFPSKDQRDWSKFKVNKSKFDPKTLEPFDKVLARDANDKEWLALLFSHINTKGKVIVAGCAWEQVIPHNDKTKHLVGTTDEAPEYYRYWED